MLDHVIVIGFLLIMLIVSAPLYIIIGIIIIGEILEVMEADEADEEYRYNQSLKKSLNKRK